MFVVEVNLAFSFYVEPTVSVSSVSIVITRVLIDLISVSSYYIS